jgi:hypothetical protein
MAKNNVGTFLLELSEYFGIDFDLKWTNQSFKRVGEKIGIKSENRIKGWLHRRPGTATLCMNLVSVHP